MSKKINFEDSLKRLEEIAVQLESGELSLDDSLKFFEEGIKLSRFCEKKLTEVEQKLEVLKSTEISEDFEIEDIDVEIETTPDEKNETQNKKKKTTGRKQTEESNLLF